MHMTVKCHPSNISAHSIVGVKHDTIGMLDELGIIKHWREDYANVFVLRPIIKSRQHSADESLSQKSWKDLFFCVPWFRVDDIYTFNFIQRWSETPVQLYAMLSVDRCQWHPICENFSQLNESTDRKSGHLEVTLRKYKQKHTLPFYHTITKDNCNIRNLNKNTKIKDFAVRLPTVIRKITIANTRQYFATIMGFDKEIIEQASIIPREITTHLSNLQDQFDYDREVVVMLSNVNVNINTNCSIINESTHDSQENIFNENEMKKNMYDQLPNDELKNDGIENNSFQIHNAFGFVHKMENKFIDNEWCFESSDMIDIMSQIDIELESMDKYDYCHDNKIVDEKFRDKIHLEQSLRCISSRLLPSFATSNARPMVYLSKQYILNKFFEPEERAILMQKCDFLTLASLKSHHSAYNDDKYTMAEKIEFDLILLKLLFFGGNVEKTLQCIMDQEEILSSVCFRSLMNGECELNKDGYTNPSCGHNTHKMYGIENLHRLMATSEYKKATFLCEFILQSLYVLIENDQCFDHRKMKKLLSFMLFEYSQVLHCYNKQQNWQDKDMLYLCHYYLSLFIAIEGLYDDDYDNKDGSIVQNTTNEKIYKNVNCKRNAW